MTFDEILTAAYDDQGYQISGVISPNPSADVIARFKRWVNEGHADLLGRPRLASLRQGTFDFTSAVGQSVYAVSDAFDVIDAVVQPTNDRRLRNMTRDWYRSIDPGERSEGTPWAWIESGYSPVLKQPFESGLWVSSRSAADTTQIATVVGALGEEGVTIIPQTVTLNGLTRVPFLTSPNWTYIRSFYLSAPPDQPVELWNAAVGGDRLSYIGPKQTATQFHLIRLWPTPSAAEPFRVDGQLKMRPLVDPTDMPFLVPALYHPALVDYVNYRAYEKNGDTLRAQVSRANYERRLNDLTNKVEFSADYRPIRGGLGPDTRRWTNLPGGYFPADGWGR
jgi:hypothetical protein